MIPACTTPEARAWQVQREWILPLSSAEIEAFDRMARDYERELRRRMKSKENENG